MFDLLNVSEEKNSSTIWSMDRLKSALWLSGSDNGSCPLEGLESWVDSGLKNVFVDVERHDVNKNTDHLEGGTPNISIFLRFFFIP